MFFQQVNRLEISPNKQFIAAAGNPHIRLYEAVMENPQHVSLFYVVFFENIFLCFFLQNSKSAWYVS